VSSLRRFNFSTLLEDLGFPSLQLIRDVETRWSSTYLMIERAIELKDVNKFPFFQNKIY